MPQPVPLFVREHGKMLLILYSSYFEEKYFEKKEISAKTLSSGNAKRGVSLLLNNGVT